MSKYEDMFSNFSGGIAQEVKVMDSYFKEQISRAEDLKAKTVELNGALLDLEDAVNNRIQCTNKYRVAVKDLEIKKNIFEDFKEDLEKTPSMIQESYFSTRTQETHIKWVSNPDYPLVKSSYDAAQEALAAATENVKNCQQKLELALESEKEIREQSNQLYEDVMKFSGEIQDCANRLDLNINSTGEIQMSLEEFNNYYENTCSSYLNNLSQLNDEIKEQLGQANDKLSNIVELINNQDTDEEVENIKKLGYKTYSEQPLSTIRFLSNLKTNIREESSLNIVGDLANCATAYRGHIGQVYSSYQTLLKDSQSAVENLSTDSINIESPIPKTGEIEKDQIDFDYISGTASDALNNVTFDKDQVHIQDWGDSEGLTYQLRDDGTVLILEGGVPLGFTTKEHISFEQGSITDNKEVNSPSDGDNNIKEESANSQSVNIEVQSDSSTDNVAAPSPETVTNDNSQPTDSEVQSDSSTDNVAIPSPETVTNDNSQPTNSEVQSNSSTDNVTDTSPETVANDNSQSINKDNTAAEEALKEHPKQVEEEVILKGE